MSLGSSLDRVPLERAVQVSVVAPCPTADERHHAGDGLRVEFGVRVCVCACVRVCVRVQRLTGSAELTYAVLSARTGARAVEANRTDPSSMAPLLPATMTKRITG